MELIITLSLVCIAVLVLMQVLSVPAAVPDRLSGKTRSYSKFLIFAFGFALTFVAAFREGFQDTGVYKFLYEQIGTEIDNAFDKDFAIQDYGFNLFMVVLNRIDSDPQLLVIVSSVITFSAYIYVIAKYSNDVPFSLLLLLLIDYIGAINGIRQVMAGAILLLLLPWLRDRKAIPYMLVVLLLSSFHASVTIMIPLYFVVSGKRMNKGIWIFFGLVVMCFAAPSVADRIMGSLLEDTVYAEYIEIESKMGVMRLLVALVPTLVALLYCWIQRRNSPAESTAGKCDPKQRLVDVLINMQMIAFGFTALGLKMVYFARICLYFPCVLALLLPEIINGCFTKESARIVKKIAIAMYLFYFAYQIYSNERVGGWAGFELAI